MDEQQVPQMVMLPDPFSARMETVTEMALQMNDIKNKAAQEVVLEGMKVLVGSLAVVVAKQQMELVVRVPPEGKIIPFVKPSK